MVDDSDIEACVVPIGLSKPSESEIIEARDAQFRGLYQDPIEQFPDKVDQLLAVTTRVRFELDDVVDDDEDAFSSCT